MKHFIRNIFFYANVVLAIALAISYIAPLVNPTTFILPAFFGLAYPFLFFANLLFVIYWILNKKWKFLLSSIVLIVGWSHISGLVQFNFNNNELKSSNSLKIMSYNVRLFDLYNWSNNKETRDKIFELIKNENADILCLQEFYFDETKQFTTLDTLLVFQEAKQVHTAYTTVVQNKYYFGIATFSKYKIINKGNILFKNTNNICIYTDILYKNDTFRIYNNHLESIHFQPENYNFIDSIAFINEEERLKGIRDIGVRLRNAYSKRAKQVDIIADHIAHSPFPVFVCGDFNDTPVSYAYQKMKADLNDAFTESGFGFGKTYKRNLLRLRIDYILHSNNFKTKNFDIIKKNYSDHYPIVSIFDVEELKK